MASFVSLPRDAHDIVESLRSVGDYQPYLTEITETLLDEGVYEGNWDVVFYTPIDSGLPNLRLIEENEYDQSMDDDENRPTTPHARLACGYLFLC